MQTQSTHAQPKTTDKHVQSPAAPLRAPVPLSPELLQQVGGAGGPRPLPKGGW
ncbi:MAG: hypothetical protein ACM32J_08390 [Rhizobacter sp.]|jgi:hypothetical protein